MNTRAVAFGSVLLLVASGIAACSGGGSGSAVSPVAPVTGPTNSPMSGPTGTLTLTIPRNTSASQRAPRYVSPNSAFLRTTVKTVNGQPPTTQQVPVNPTTTALSTGAGGNCTVSPAGETCTVTIPAPSGTVVYQFDLLDAAQHVLATNTVTLTITPGSTNPALTAQLDGVVASVTITAPHLQPGTAFSGPITVQAFDASGAQIVGPAPFAFAFTLTDNDPTTHTSLTDGTTGKTVTDGSPSDTVILNYDGANIPSFTISYTLYGGGAANAATVTVSESSYLGPFTFTDNGTCSGKATIALKSGSTGNGPSSDYTVTGIANGQCDVTFKDAFNQTASTHIIVTTSGFTITSHQRR